MSKEVFFLGEPVQFKPGIMIYPPKVKDVVANESFSIYNRLLTYSQEEIEDEFVEAQKKLETYPTPIEFMLNNSYHNKEYEKQCKAAFCFFIHKEVTFLYEQKSKQKNHSRALPLKNPWLPNARFNAGIGDFVRWEW